jgi:hypothetical protein
LLLPMFALCGVRTPYHGAMLLNDSVFTILDCQPCS